MASSNARVWAKSIRVRDRILFGVEYLGNAENQGSREHAWSLNNVVFPGRGRADSPISSSKRRAAELCWMPPKRVLAFQAGAPFNNRGQFDFTFRRIIQGCTKPRRTAYRTRVAVSWISNFCMSLVRCDSAVFTLMPRREATSFVDLPSAMSWSTWRSRSVSGSEGISDLVRYASTTARETPGLK